MVLNLIQNGYLPDDSQRVGDLVLTFLKQVTVLNLLLNQHPLPIVVRQIRQQLVEVKLRLQIALVVLRQTLLVTIVNHRFLKPLQIHTVPQLQHLLNVIVLQCLANKHHQLVIPQQLSHKHKPQQILHRVVVKVPLNTLQLRNTLPKIHLQLLH